METEIFNSSNETISNTTGYDQYFTESEEGLNIVAHNIEATCITSSNNKFSLDSNGNLTVNSINISDAKNNTLSFEAIMNRLYPVGTVYETTEDVNPGTLFTGTWEKIEGVYLVGAGTYTDSANVSKTFTAGATVGAWNHTHIIPKHNHGLSDKGYAKIYFGETNFYAKDFETSNWTGNARKTVSGSNSTSSRTCNYGTGLGGTTNDKAEVTSGSTYHVNPSYVVHIWKRIA